MRRSKAPAGTSRRGGLALLRRLTVFRQAAACRAIQTPEPAKPRMHHSAERRALGLRLCARHAPRYYVSAPRQGKARRSAGPVTLHRKQTFNGVAGMPAAIFTGRSRQLKRLSQDRGSFIRSTMPTNQTSARGWSCRSRTQQIGSVAGWWDCICQPRYCTHELRPASPRRSSAGPLQMLGSHLYWRARPAQARLQGIFESYHARSCHISLCAIGGPRRGVILFGDERRVSWTKAQ